VQVGLNAAITRATASGLLTPAQRNRRKISSIPREQPLAKRFNLVHILPSPRLHGLNGYREVIDSVAWGLNQLGHEVTLGLNQFESDAVNIIFGFQMLKERQLRELSRDTIIYNFEQIAGVPSAELKPAYAAAAARLQVWDYSEFNLPTWQRVNPVRAPIHVPVGWAPVLETIGDAEQDIDVLFYGMSGKPRFQVIDQLCRRGVSCVFACGLYGRARDALIARAKLVLNINLLEHSGIFEIVRVSYLLANRKAVVADRRAASMIEADILDAVHFTSLEQMPEACMRLLEDEAGRRELGARGQAAIRRRDVREILRTALQD
jgi:hypothetical protein